MKICQKCSCPYEEKLLPFFTQALHSGFIPLINNQSCINRLMSTETLIFLVLFTHPHLLHFSRKIPKNFNIIYCNTISTAYDNTSSFYCIQDAIIVHTVMTNSTSTDYSSKQLFFRLTVEVLINCYRIASILCSFEVVYPYVSPLIVSSRCTSRLSFQIEILHVSNQLILTMYR